MREGRYLALIVLLAYCVRELWTVLPKDRLIQPYLFSDQQIQLQTYIWAGSMYLFFLIFSIVAYRLSNKLRLFFEAVLVVQALEFIEYFCNYNEYWGYVWIVPINITTLRFPVLFIVMLITFKRWKI